MDNQAKARMLRHMIGDRGPVRVARILGVDAATLNDLLAGRIPWPDDVSKQFQLAWGHLPAPADPENDLAALEPDGAQDEGLDLSGVPALKGRLDDVPAGENRAAPLPDQSAEAGAANEADALNRIILWRALRIARRLKANKKTGGHVKLAAQVVILTLEIELIVRYQDSMPEAGAQWDAERRDRERAAKAVKRRNTTGKQDKYHGGVLGLLRWLMGQSRVSNQRLYDDLLAEAETVDPHEVPMYLWQEIR